MGEVGCERKGGSIGGGGERMSRGQGRRGRNRRVEREGENGGRGKEKENLLNLAPIFEK